jgi:hypothetical protein
MDAPAQQTCPAGTTCGGAAGEEACTEFLALAFGPGELNCWPDAYSVDSMPSMGSLSGLPSMSMSFDLQVGEGTAAALGGQVPEHPAYCLLPKDTCAAAAGIPPDACALSRCEHLPPVMPTTAPPNLLPKGHPPADPLQFHQQPTATATATPAIQVAAATASGFWAHCQVRPSAYPQIQKPTPVPTGQQIHERMCAIRKEIERQAKFCADTKQLRGGSHAATKQLEMQLDLVLRDYSTRLDQYLRGYSEAVAQQQLLLQERTSLLGSGPDVAHCRGQVVAAEAHIEAKLSTLALECVHTIDGALQGYRRDSTQLLAKYKEQQKKKEKLPDSAVDTLNTWLQENFANPYPTTSQKLALVQSTGLEMKQINQWFINARVRVWRPAVQMMMDEQPPR